VPVNASIAVKIPKTYMQGKMVVVEAVAKSVMTSKTDVVYIRVNTYIQALDLPYGYTKWILRLLMA
jgi:hypothetical protein